MEIDYDYLWTGTAIGFRASHELCSNYLFSQFPAISSEFTFEVRGAAENYKNNKTFYFWSLESFKVIDVDTT